MTDRDRSEPSSFRPVTLRFLLICSLAFIVRLAFLWQARGNPFFDYPIGDGRAYYEWAGRIAGGEWLGYEVFYQAPLYPYFLGLLRTIGLGGFRAVYVVQSLLGGISCGLVYLAGRRLFGQPANAVSVPGAGEAAGVLLALYAPAIFFDGILQKATLDFFLMSCLVLLLAMVVLASDVKPGRTALKLAGVGALVGLLSLTRENALVLAPVIIVWLLTQSRIARRAALLGAFVGGLALVLLPVMARNRVVGGDFVLTTSQMGPNFFMGNNPNADGTYMELRYGRGDPRYERADARDLAELAVGRKLSPSEVSSYWMGLSMQYIRSRPMDWLALMSRKWLLFWNAYEVPDEEDIYLLREYSPLMSVLSRTFSFGLLCPLALAGMVLTWRQRRRLWLFYALIVAFAASVTAFYIFGRYRHAIAPILALFAGVAVAGAIEAVRRRNGRELLYPAIAFVAAAVVINWPSSVGDPSKPSRYVLACTLAERGDVAGAEKNYRTLLADDPRHADSHFNLANILRQKAVASGDRPDVWRPQLQEAIEHYRAAIEARPDWPMPCVNLGISYGMIERYPEAEQCFRRAMELDPTYLLAHQNLAQCLGREGRWRDAVAALRDGVRLCPDDREMRVQLAWLLAAAPDADARNGAESLRMAEELVRGREAEDADALVLLAAAQAENGLFKEAEATALKAADLAEKQGHPELAEIARSRAKLHGAGRPYRVSGT